MPLPESTPPESTPPPSSSPASPRGASFPPQPESAAQAAAEERRNATIRGKLIGASRDEGVLLPCAPFLTTARPRFSDHWNVAIPPVYGSADALIEYGPALKFVAVYWP